MMASSGIQIDREIAESTDFATVPGVSQTGLDWDYENNLY